MNGLANAIVGVGIEACLVCKNKIVMSWAEMDRTHGHNEIRKNTKES